MQNIVLSYDPYRMKTQMSVDGIDVCENENYSRFKEFIQNGTPMQTWIEPIPYLDWRGFVNEISDEDTNDNVHIDFSGRIIDLEDLKRSVAAQNDKRSETTKVKYVFNHVKILDDMTLSQNIENVVSELETPMFQQLIRQRGSKSLNDKYNALKDNYRLAQENDFYIVFAGLYSSGKSTLLNAVIRHDVLPTSFKTCTSKNCRIRHDRSIGNKVSLTCFGQNDEVVIPKRVFDSDEECEKAFSEICPIKDKNSEDKYPDVVTMELSADLSHLYPKNISNDKFNIVLIDTPGMDSAQSSENGVNKHAQIAMEAITMENKPMIILCVDAQTYENKSIGEFMREIVVQANKENSGFNDRFLFLMNKSDCVQYKNGESAEELKSEFAEYLTDHNKWNITADDHELNEISKAASCFVPRIFMTTAGCAYAIQRDALNFSDEQLDIDENYDLKSNLEKFMGKICDRKRDNFFLSKYCDIPHYRKNEIESEFQNALENNDRIRATELQCGLVSVEYAIRDYIERYAYPIKVRGVLSTFEDVLEDVRSFQNGIVESLKEAEKNLGESHSEREEATERKKSAETKSNALKLAKDKIDEQQRSLNQIKFNPSEIYRIIENFKAEIDKDRDIQRIYQNDEIKTGQKSKDKVITEINNLMSDIRSLMQRKISDANRELIKVKNSYDGQLKEIFGYLSSAVDQLKKSGALNYDSYDFTKSLIWTSNFSYMSAADVASASSGLRESIKDSTTKTETVWNSKKEDYKASWNPFKKLASLFMSDTIEQIVDVSGFYKTAPLKKALSNYFNQLDQESKKMGDYFTKEINSSKYKVNTLTKQLLNEIDAFYADIEKQRAEIERCGKSIEELNKKIESEKKINEWLIKLSEEISGV